MTDFLDRDDERDERLQWTRPETDLSEGNASRHYTEDFRRRPELDDNPGLLVDPVTGEPIVLP
jgi:hypothetical protein